MIKQLPNDIISKIAAGEVITSLKNIVKEMIENSIDANSSEISIEVSSKRASITIIDNGDGISKDDLPNLCMRHYTSKFNGSFYEIPTFGFRGEALASISLCSKILVKSRKDDSEIGYEADYLDCKMQNIRPIAAKKGTRIEINDIFYNNTFRKNYFIGKREEITNVFFLVANFSIRYSDIEFKLFIDDCLKHELIHKIKKNRIFNETFSLNNNVFDDLLAQKQLVRSIYKIGDHLLSTKSEKCKLIISDVSYNYRKYIFIIFINGRLVDHKILKERIKNLYKDMIPKNKYPFIYIEISIPFSSIDVNVHPEKKEVIFFEEESMVDCVVKETQKLLENNNRSKINKISENVNINSFKALNNSQIIYTDPHSSSLYEIFETNNNIINSKKIKKYRLKSIENLKKSHKEIDSEFLKNLIYVGEFDEHIVVQSGASLMLCKSSPFKFEYFRQRLTFLFGNYDMISCNHKLEFILTDKHKSILIEYFCFEFEENNILKIPSIDKISITDNLTDFIKDYSSFEPNDELKTFEFIINNLSEVFKTAIKEIGIFFNSIKRNAIGTEDVLKNFYCLTTLNELYKMFERC